MLPGMDGYKILKKMQRDPPLTFHSSPDANR